MYYLMFGHISHPNVSIVIDSKTVRHVKSKFNTTCIDLTGTLFHSYWFEPNALFTLPVAMSKLMIVFSTMSEYFL